MLAPSPATPPFWSPGPQSTYELHFPSSFLVSVLSTPELLFWDQCGPRCSYVPPVVVCVDGGRRSCLPTVASLHSSESWLAYCLDASLSLADAPVRHHAPHWRKVGACSFVRPPSLDKSSPSSAVPTWDAAWPSTWMAAFSEPSALSPCYFPFCSSGAAPSGLRSPCYSLGCSLAPLRSPRRLPPVGASDAWSAAAAGRASRALILSRKNQKNKKKDEQHATRPEFTFDAFQLGCSTCPGSSAPALGLSEVLPRREVVAWRGGRLGHFPRPASHAGQEGVCVRVCRFR
jgi:hypothetical protein